MESVGNHVLFTDVFCSPEVIYVPCNILGYHLVWTFRFVAVLVCGRFGLWPFRFVAVSVCGRFGLWPFRVVAVPVCGRFGLWPFRFVAFSVCGRFGCGRFGLWPLWSVTVLGIDYPEMVNRTVWDKVSPPSVALTFCFIDGMNITIVSGYMSYDRLVYFVIIS